MRLMGPSCDWSESEVKNISQKQREKEKYFLKRDEGTEVIYSSESKHLIFSCEIFGIDETLPIKGKITEMRRG